MHNCQSLDSLVTPFVDGELPDADRRDVEAHLRVCAPCHSRVAAERAVHDLLRARTPALCKAEAPDALHARCAGFVRAPENVERGASNPEPRTSNLEPRTPNPARRTPQLERRAPGAGWPTRLAPYALAASLVTVVGGAFVYQATDKSARVLAAELVADHAKCFALNGVLGGRQQPATVEQSMASMFDWRMHLPENPARAGLELVGARPCFYGEGRVAHIMYRHDGHPVSLFMLPNTARAEQLVEVLGHEAAIWCANNRTFVLVSREPRRDVERMASFVQASLH
jgi:anti-sigma factor RsiW